MDANKIHISLETARLLEDCKLSSKYIFAMYDIPIVFETVDRGDFVVGLDAFPAYTWQEILWEPPTYFFGEDNYTKGGLIYIAKYHAGQILELLQKKKYEEADLYFRKKCVFINNA